MNLVKSKVNPETPEEVPQVPDVGTRIGPKPNEKEKERSRTSGAARKRERKRAIAKRDGMKCNYCTKPFRRLSEATIDHFIPLSKGGTSKLNNLVLACHPCNNNKRNQIFIR